MSETNSNTDNKSKEEKKPGEYVKFEEIKPEEKPKEKNTPVKKNALFSESNKSFDDLMSEMDESKEEFTSAADVPTDDIEDNEDINTDSPKKDEDTQVTETAKKKIGKSIFLSLDNILTFFASLYSGEPKSSFKLPQDDRQELINAWSDVAEVYNWSKPPAATVIIIFMLIGYGSMAKAAIDIKKEKKAGKTKKRDIPPMEVVRGPHDDNINFVGVVDPERLKPIDIPKNKGKKGRMSAREAELAAVIKEQNIRLNMAYEAFNNI